MRKNWFIVIFIAATAGAQTPPPAPKAPPAPPAVAPADRLNNAVRDLLESIPPVPPIPPARPFDTTRIDEAVQDLLDSIPPIPPVPPADLIDGVIGGIEGGIAGGIAGGIPGPDFANLASRLSLLAQVGPPNPVPKPGAWVKDRRFKDSENNLYERGQRAIEKRQYEEALGYFNEVASGGGTRADGALYWKAYTENKLGRRSEALATINQLRTGHASSRWLDDAKALEAEVRAAQGQPPKPEDESNDELKLMALNSLAQNDPERAIPMIEKLLTSAQAPKLKERALFVLMQTGSPKAREVVVAIANGKGNPDLQLRAINHLGSLGGRKELAQVYASASDPNVKRAVLRGFMASGAREELFNAAKSEKDPELRREAIRQLGAMGMQTELWQLYQSEGDQELKKELLRSFSASGGSDKLMELAKADKDAEVRREAIRHLSNMDRRRSMEGLVALYSSEQDREVKKEIIRALSNNNNAVPLIDIARKETDPELKREIVRRLSNMRSKEATDYMLELLK